MSGGGGSPSPFSGPDVLGAADSIQSASGAALGNVAGGNLVCDRLVFDARLHSINRDELDRVNVGQTLHVLLFRTSRPQVGVFVDPDTASAPPVGVLIDRIVDLFPCLQIRNYDAEVLSINGGDVRVRIYPAVSD